MEINNNYFLQEEISIDILSRLPTMPVIRCSLVNKSWRNLIVYNRDFARIRGLESHHGASVSNGRLNFLLLTYSGMKEGFTLYYTLDDDNYEKAIPAFRVLGSNPKNYYVVGSCNGLICMAYDIEYDRQHEFEQPMYICNPITREWLTLPSLTINECCCSSCSTNDPTSVSGYRKVVCGFDYRPSTDEYKVVRIAYCYHAQSFGRKIKVFTTSGVGRVHVYTLGDGIGWRDKGEIIGCELAYNCNQPSILANEALHFVQENEGKIVAFDLADEEFLFLPPPPCFTLDDDEEDPFKIQVLGGHLCAFHRNENSIVEINNH